MLKLKDLGPHPTLGIKITCIVWVRKVLPTCCSDRRAFIERQNKPVFFLSGMKEEKQQVCEALEAFSHLNDEGTEGSKARL